MNEKLLKFTAIVFYLLAVLLISFFVFLNSFIPLKSLFDLGVDPLYLGIIMFLLSFIIILAYIGLRRHYEILGEGLPYQDRQTLFTITLSYSLLPATFPY